VDICSEFPSKYESTGHDMSGRFFLLLWSISSHAEKMKSIQD